METRLLAKVVVALIISMVLAAGADAVEEGLFEGDAINRDALIRFYFEKGYTYCEIIGYLLLSHNTVLSLRQLKRFLKRLGLRRNGIESSSCTLLSAVKRVQAHGFHDLGYKLMWRLLNTRYNVRITEKTTRILMQLLDEDGVRRRSRHRLRRRMYTNKGPNFLIHIDGNDKLKPFGISLHGAMDGYSRRLIWLKAGFTNKNSRHVLGFYLDFVLRTMRVPRCVRSDNGTENALVRDVHKALRSQHVDTNAGIPSFLTGRSTANQRIEMFWGILYKNLLSFWKHLFEDLRDSFILDQSDEVHIECLRFCFLPLIQMQLDNYRIMWNTHRVRSQRDIESLCGVPNVLYFQPELFESKDYSMPVMSDRHEIEEIANMYACTYPRFGCQEEFLQLIETLSGYNRNELVSPMSVTQALEMFVAVTNKIADFQ